MDNLWPSFGIGFVAGLRNMTACAALTWAAAFGKTRNGWIPAGMRPRGLATEAALVEMAGDKMPFVPDRRIAPSVLARSPSARWVARHWPDGMLHWQLV